MYNNSYVESVYNKLEGKFSNETEFLQATKEILSSIESEVSEIDEKENVLERLFNYDRMIEFKVVWEDDNQCVHVNKGYRIQQSKVLGPYKGGIRLNKTVTPSILKFLALEQVFKNCLTGLPIGGAKGGSDFDPKGKSDREVMRFCQAFMRELYRHIGQDTDIPAGDIGTGAREIGYLTGEYMRLTNTFNGTISGKVPAFGGSLCRTEATGYGLVYFVECMMKQYRKEDLRGKKVIITGSGNVAVYACEKAQSLGAIVIAMSDSSGCVYNESGLNLAAIKEIKEVKRGRIKEYLTYDKAAVYEENSASIFNHKCEICLPCATQNEINLKTAKLLVKNGCYLVAEGANMPNSNEAINYYLENGILFSPGKASNAGGVSVSTIEMSQNAMHTYFSFDEVDEKLEKIMKNIFKQAYEYANSINDEKNLVKAVNCLAYRKIRDAIIAQGL